MPTFYFSVRFVDTNLSAAIIIYAKKVFCNNPALFAPKKTYMQCLCVNHVLQPHFNKTYNNNITLDYIGVKIILDH